MCDNIKYVQYQAHFSTYQVQFQPPGPNTATSSFFFRLFFSPTKQSFIVCLSRGIFSFFRSSYNFLLQVVFAFSQSSRSDSIYFCLTARPRRVSWKSSKRKPCLPLSFWFCLRRAFAATGLASPNCWQTVFHPFDSRPSSLLPSLYQLYYLPQLKRPLISSLQLLNIACTLFSWQIFLSNSLYIFCT